MTFGTFFYFCFMKNGFNMHKENNTLYVGEDYGSFPKINRSLRNYIALFLWISLMFNVKPK